MFTAFVIGVAIAFLTSIPVGPVGLLCISQSIARGKWSGFVVGLGAAVVDVFFAVVAAYGLISIVHFIKDYSFLFHIVSFCTLIGVAIYFLRTKSHLSHESRKSVSHSENFLISAFLNITNPFTIFGFFTLFAMAGLGHGMRGQEAFSVVLGVFVGACLWWYILSSVADRFESRMNDRTLTALNRAFGILILLFVAFVAMKFAVSLLS